jgi:hypothetical protein
MSLKSSVDRPSLSTERYRAYSESLPRDWNRRDGTEFAMADRLHPPKTYHIAKLRRSLFIDTIQ